MDLSYILHSNVWLSTIYHQYKQIKLWVSLLMYCAKTPLLGCRSFSSWLSLLELLTNRLLSLLGHIWHRWKKYSFFRKNYWRISSYKTDFTGREVHSTFRLNRENVKLFILFLRRNDRETRCYQTWLPTRCYQTYGFHLPYQNCVVSIEKMAIKHVLSLIIFMRWVLWCTFPIMTKAALSEGLLMFQ